MDRFYEKKWTLLVWNLNGVFPDLSRYFEIVDASGYEKADAYLLWTEFSEYSKYLGKYARHFNRPVFVGQHGLNLEGVGAEYAEDKLPKKEADYYFVWGDVDKKLLYKGGWKDREIVDIGCSFLNCKVPWVPDGKSVGFAPIHHNPDYAGYEIHKLIDVRIWQRLSKIKGIVPIVKTLAEDGMFKNYLGYQFMTVRNSPQQIDHIAQTYKYLSTLNVLVTSYISTLWMYCASIGLPVIKVLNESDSTHQDGAINIQEDQLEETIRGVMSGEVVHDMNTISKYARHNPDIEVDIKNLIYKELTKREHENSYSDTFLRDKSVQPVY